MSDIINKSEQLLSEKTVNLIIGYEKGTGKKIRPAFIRKAEDTGKLLFNEDCSQNLAVYVLKAEVKKAGKIALFATASALRSLLQLAAENQVRDEEIIALHLNKNNELVVFGNFKSIEDYLAGVDTGLTEKEKEALAKLNAMTQAERWEFWTGEFEKCIKCYACRAACPMCYCHRCTTDCNQPQWIPVASHALGAFEWHLMRAMHLSGRCVNCGECAEACPVDIPLNLLTYSLIDAMKEDFGTVAGMKADAKYALSTFKPEDKESFIM
jgi:ferredoxin